MASLDVAAALRARGYATDTPAGLDGAVRAFQRDAGLAADGIVGPHTLAALGPGIAVSPGVVDPLWMPAASMSRIVVHWTAGAHRASALDRAHYHILIEGDGTLVRGVPSIRDNQAPPRAGYAAHTLNCNSGSIGVSLCCMAGAVEQPFAAGPAPMTRAQWDRLPGVLADLCARYGIAVTPRTVLSHAEVQPTLGIKQRGKWDIARLAFDPSVIGARACGDVFRARTLAALSAAA